MAFKWQHTFKFAYKHGSVNEKVNTIFGGFFPRNIILSKEGKILFNKAGGSENSYRELEIIIKENL